MVAASAEDLGIRCPKCGGEYHAVRDKRSAPKFRNRRRRICDACDWRFSTYEMRCDEVEALEEAKRERDELVAMMARARSA